jgi:hypothetical protein
MGDPHRSLNDGARSVSERAPAHLASLDASSLRPPLLDHMFEELRAKRACAAAPQRCPELRDLLQGGSRWITGRASG